MRTTYVLKDKKGKELHNGDLLLHKTKQTNYKLIGFVVKSQTVMVRPVGAMGGFTELPISLFDCTIEEQK